MVMWEAHVGESFIMLHESSNDPDRHEIAKTYHYFTKHEGKTMHIIPGKSWIFMGYYPLSSFSLAQSLLLPNGSSDSDSLSVVSSSP